MGYKGYSPMTSIEIALSGKAAHMIRGQPLRVWRMPLLKREAKTPHALLTNVSETLNGGTQNGEASLYVMYHDAKEGGVVTLLVISPLRSGTRVVF